MNIRLSLDKCKFAEKNAEWLWFHLFQTGIKLLNSRIQSITARLQPKTPNELRFFKRGEPDESTYSKYTTNLLSVPTLTEKRK